MCKGLKAGAATRRLRGRGTGEGPLAVRVEDSKEFFLICKLFFFLMMCLCMHATRVWVPMGFIELELQAVVKCIM